MMRYLVSGICMVPMQAETVVDAASPEQALKIAKDQWKQDHRRLIVSGSADEAAAYDWRPTAEPSTD